MIVSGHHVYALDASNGNVVWSFQADAAVTAAPRISRGFVSQLDRVYFGDLGGNVYALNANTGAFSWKASGAGPIAASVAVVGGAVDFVDVSGTAHALDASNGSNLWTFFPLFLADAHTGLLSSNGLLYVTVTSTHLTERFVSIYAIDPNTGVEDWRWDDIAPSALPGFDDGKTLEPPSLLTV